LLHLMEDDLEPEFRGLMDHDENELIVVRRFGQGPLKLEKPVDLEIALVRRITGLQGP